MGVREALGVLVKLLIQLITVIRILIQRGHDHVRSWYWKNELQRNGATVGRYFRMRRGAELSLVPGCRITIGDNVTLAERSRIHIGPNAALTVGDDVFIGTNSVIACRQKVQIGSASQIAHNVTVIDHDHSLSSVQTVGTVGAVEVGHGVWIGANALILKGVQIYDHAVIAAGAIVTKQVPSGNLAHGRAAENRPL